MTPLAKYISVLVCLFALKTGQIYSRDKTDSLKNELKNAVHDTTRLRIYGELINEEPNNEVWSGYTEQMHVLAERNLAKNPSEALKKIYLKYLAIAFNYYGMLENDKGDIQKSMLFYEKAIAIAEKINDKNLNAEIFQNLGYEYQKTGDIAKAMDYFQKSLKISEELNNLDLMATTLNSLGTVYKSVGDTLRAIENFKKSYGILNKLGDKTNVARALTLIGSVYYDAGNMTKALDYYTGSLKINEERNDKYAIANCYNNIGTVYGVNKDWPKALTCFLKSLEIQKEIGDKYSIAASYRNIGAVYFKQNDLSGSLKYSLKSLELSGELGFPELIRNSADILSKIYRKQKKPAQALEMYDLYILMRDSIRNDQNKKISIEAQIQAEFDKKEAVFKAEKEKEILQLEIEKSESTLLAQQRKSAVIISVISGLLLITLLVFILFRNHSRKKQREIEFEKSALEYEQQALRAQMNPHFIFNAINSIQKYILKGNQQEAYDYLARFAKLIRIVLNNSQEKALQLDQELEMIQLYVELEQLRFSNSFDFDLQVDENVNGYEITVPAMLIQPYIENAIWHGLMNLENERKGMLNLAISQSEGLLKIRIEDNGIGRDRSKEYRQDDSHRSVGMALTEQRLMMINKMQEYENARVIVTDLRDEKGEACGTKVEINIPVK
jgi:tetratricopeptide (TPR) repeat protein